MSKIIQIAAAILFLWGGAVSLSAQTVKDLLDGEPDNMPDTTQQTQPAPQTQQPAPDAQADDSGTQTDAAQKPDSDDTASADSSDSSSAGGDEIQFSIIAGATTVDGENFQQLGIRGDFPIGKFGFGLDLQILLDEEGNVRKEDWDEAVDYMDKIYYIRWAKKGDPFYIRIGGLDYTYLGYGSTVWGYSNMVEYPTYKRVGVEMSVDTESFGMEYFMNDFKELVNNKPSVVTGGRLVYKPIDRISIGASIAADINQYNGLRDNDGDDYPDEIDFDRYDKNVAAEEDKYINAGITDPTVIQDLKNAGLISPLTRADLFTISDNQQPAAIYGADLGFQIIKGQDADGNKNFIQLDVYSQWAMLHQTKGWGFAAPGVMLRVGPVKFMADYRQTTDKFIFGYFNNTYELERAGFDTDENGNPVPATKLDSMEYVKASRGVFASLGFDIFGLAELKADYEMLIEGKEPTSQSLTTEFSVKKGLIPKISGIKAYYVNNDVKNLKKWKAESAILGYQAGFEVAEGVAIVFDTRYTFEDKNADGQIKEEDDEIVKTFSISTTSVF